MEDKIKKKKKLTLKTSSKKIHNASHYAQGRGKTSVIIEKKITRRWGEKKFQPRDDNTTKRRTTGDSVPKKPLINKNFDLRKMAEEKATKRIKNLKEENLQQKKKR